MGSPRGAAVSDRLVRRTGRVWAWRDTLTVLGEQGKALRFEGPSADLAQAVLEHLTVPRTRVEILEHLSLHAERPVDDPVVDELLGALRSVGAVGDAVVLSPRPPSGHRVLLGITGAIGAMHAPTLVTACQREGWDVRVMATRNALRFVSERALEALTHAPVFTSHWRSTAGVTVPHLDLARDASLVMVAPCTATTLSRIAQGDCSEVVAATVLSTRAPVLLAPSMNEAMYTSEAVRRNLRRLRDDGVHIVIPTAGVEVAELPHARSPKLGPAPEASDLVAIARAILANHRPVAPRDGAMWETLWRNIPVHELPWSVDRLEPDLAAVLTALVRKGDPCLDLGTGAGTGARHLARLGATVTATDIAPSAIATARTRSNDGISWCVDDVTASSLTGVFSRVVDRGLLHVLPPEHRPRWIAAIRRVTAPGSVVVLLCHDKSVATATGTYGMTEAELQALLEPLCDDVRVLPSEMHGPHGTRRRAWLAIGRVEG